MASIINDPGGKRRIQFTDADGDRKSIRLSKLSRRDAEALNVRVEALNSAALAGHAPDPATAEWVKELGLVMRRKLERVGLLASQIRRGRTLSHLLAAFFDSISVKKGTLATYRQTESSLVSFFGKAAALRQISPLEAQKWRESMVREELAGATISKRVKTARGIFSRAVRWKMIAENPFEGVKAGGERNPERLHFVDLRRSRLVLDACPDAEWRVIFALSRWGGLRCPSEHMALRWSDIKWDQHRFVVRENKTIVREVPLFPELERELLNLLEQAPEGSEYVITRHRGGAGNLRTPMKRILDKAGISLWPRLFHNLRATRQTELVETFPAHVVCAWIGNSEKVARAHYLSVRDEDFEKAARNTAQQIAARGGMERQMDKTNPIGAVKNAVPSGQPRSEMTPTGLELSKRSQHKTGRGDDNGAESSARDAIPDHIRMRRALAVIDAASGSEQEGKSTTVA